ncbi:hypothetical protein DVH05_025603 [Phytophthora capsici]|nr:hypothetical protein DVH05_025603 [Phytophthora capsici]
MIQFMWTIRPEWMASCVARRSDGGGALDRMVQRIANRYGFSSHKPQAAKQSAVDLEETRAAFSIQFWEDYSSYEGGGVLNVDETANLFDMPPIRSWAGKDRKDSARVLGTNKHAGRMTAVLTVRDDEMKLPILFIIRGVPGGRLQANKMSGYSDGHLYAF